MAKSLEDYLLSYEDRLLHQLNDVFTNQNKNFFIVYILTATFVLFEAGMIDDIVIFGIKMKLDINHFRLKSFQAIHSISISVFLCFYQFPVD